MDENEGRKLLRGNAEDDCNLVTNEEMSDDNEILYAVITIYED